MLFRTHIAFALFLYLVLFSFIDFKILFFIGLVIGVLIVDIDSSKSKAGKTLFLRPFQLFVRHRGFIHSILFGVLLALFISIFKIWIALGFICGFLSHLFLDSLNKQGIMFFWPISFKRFSLMDIKVSGFIEKILFILLILIDFILVLLNFLPQLF